MKIINWWIDRYSISGLFIASILFAIMGLILLCHVFFNFSIADKLGLLSLEYNKGIAVPVKFNSSPGGDTSVMVRAVRNKDTAMYKIYRPDIHGQWKAIAENFAVPFISTDSIVYRDTIFPDYQTMNSRPPWKDNWSNVTKVNFETGTVYIKPDSFYNRGLLLAPQIIFFVVLAYFCWQLAFFLDNIQRSAMFTLSNCRKIRNLGLSVIIYQLLLFVVYLLENTYYIKVDYRSTIPDFRSPVYFHAEADYHLGWSYLIAGCILLIVAKAFYKGYTLQQEQALTI
jgi:hypothetical protein